MCCVGQNVKKVYKIQGKNKQKNERNFLFLNGFLSEMYKKVYMSLLNLVNILLLWYNMNKSILSDRGRLSWIRIKTEQKK